MTVSIVFPPLLPSNPVIYPLSEGDSSERVSDAHLQYELSQQIVPPSADSPFLVRVLTPSNVVLVTDVQQADAATIGFRFDSPPLPGTIKIQDRRLRLLTDSAIHLVSLDTDSYTDGKPDRYELVIADAVSDPVVQGIWLGPRMLVTTTLQNPHMTLWTSETDDDPVWSFSPLPAVSFTSIFSASTPPPTAIAALTSSALLPHVITTHADGKLRCWSILSHSCVATLDLSHAEYENSRPSVHVQEGAQAVIINLSQVIHIQWDPEGRVTGLSPHIMFGLNWPGRGKEYTVKDALFSRTHLRVLTNDTVYSISGEDLNQTLRHEQAWSTQHLNVSLPPTQGEWDVIMSSKASETGASLTELAVRHLFTPSLSLGALNRAGYTDLPHAIKLADADAQSAGTRRAWLRIASLIREQEIRGHSTICLDKSSEAIWTCERFMLPQSESAEDLVSQTMFSDALAIEMQRRAWIKDKLSNGRQAWLAEQFSDGTQGGLLLQLAASCHDWKSELQGPNLAWQLLAQKLPAKVPTWYFAASTQEEADATLLIDKYLLGRSLKDEQLLKEAAGCWAEAMSLIGETTVRTLTEYYAHCSMLLDGNASLSRMALRHGHLSDNTARSCWLAIESDSLQQQDWSGWFDMLIQIPFEDLKRDSLTSLIEQLAIFEPSLISTLPWTDSLYKEVERILAFKIRNTDPLALDSNWFKIAASTYWTRNDWQAGVTVMYQRAQGIALKACVPETFHHHTTSAATSYLDALNFIAASDGKVSWIAYSSNPEGLASSTNSSIPESEFTSAHQSPELVTVSDIKLKYHLTLCRLQLAEHYPELMSSAAPLAAEDALTLLAQSGEFASAFRLGKEIKQSLTSVFITLTKRCISLSTMTKSSNLANFNNFLYSDEVASQQEGTESERAWAMLKRYLSDSKSDQFNNDYYEAVLRTILTAGFSVPMWLTARFQSTNFEFLIRGLLRHKRHQEAYEMTNDLINQRNRSFIIDSKETHMSYKLLDRVLSNCGTETSAATLEAEIGKRIKFLKSKQRPILVNASA